MLGWLAGWLPLVWPCLKTFLSSSSISNHLKLFMGYQNLPALWQITYRHHLHSSPSDRVVILTCPLTPALINDNTNNSVPGDTKLIRKTLFVATYHRRRPKEATSSRNGPGTSDLTPCFSTALGRQSKQAGHAGHTGLRHPPSAGPPASAAVWHGTLQQHREEKNK
jgi:hypothetical protein